MKTTPLSKLMVLAVVVTAGSLSQKASGVQTQYDLTLTENSSTSLSLAYTGPGGTSNFLVTPNGTDMWTISSQEAGVAFFEFTWDWIEPEESDEVNEAYTGDMTFLHSSFTIISDLDLEEYGGGTSTTLSDGSRTPIAVGTHSGVPIFLTFIDKAAASESVPDSGSSFVLLAIAATGLIGLKRLRFA